MIRTDEIKAKLRERLGKMNSKSGKIIAMLLLAMFMATASASVFATYYGHGTATVRAADLQLLPGSDNSAGTTYPSANVTVSNNNYATVAINIFASAVHTPQPAAYFTDLLQIKNNGAGQHNITQIVISGITDSNSILGNITVYFCTSQTNDPASSHAGVFYMTTTSGGNVLSSTQAIAAGATAYIEIVAFAKSTATAGQSVSFDMAIQWN